MGAPIARGAPGLEGPDPRDRPTAYSPCQGVLNRLRSRPDDELSSFPRSRSGGGRGTFPARRWSPLVGGYVRSNQSRYSLVAAKTVPTAEARSMTELTGGNRPSSVRSVVASRSRAPTASSLSTPLALHIEVKLELDPLAPGACNPLVRLAVGSPFTCELGDGSGASPFLKYWK